MDLVLNIAVTVQNKSAQWLFRGSFCFNSKLTPSHLFVASASFSKSYLDLLLAKLRYLTAPSRLQVYQLQPGQLCMFSGAARRECITLRKSFLIRSSERLRRREKKGEHKEYSIPCALR